MTESDNNYNYIVSIGKTISNFFSSLAIAVASFSTIAALIALVDSDGRVIVQGNEVKVSLAFVTEVILLSFLLLGMSCLVLYILREVSDD